MSHKRKNSRRGASKFSTLIEKLEGLKNSPLEVITASCLDALKTAYLALQKGTLEHSKYEVILNLIEQTYRILPKSFNERFQFDHGIIEGIAGSWNRKGQVLSGILIPQHDEEWSHKSTFLPTEYKNGMAVSLNIISFPGEDNTDDIFLLDYGFLLHELGHNLFFYKHPLFSKLFQHQLSKVISSLKLRSVSDRGLAKSRSDKTLQLINDYWQPKTNHKDWSHETAVDLVALWTCGPAYLKAFQIEVENNQHDPFLVSPDHPPYAFRCEVLLDACERLSLQRYTNNLENLLSKWRRAQRNKKTSAQYASLTGDKLRTSVIEASFSAFRQLSLPKCDKNLINSIERKLKNNMPLQLGLELIIGAWLYHDIYGNDEYDKWEQQQIDNFLEDFKP